MKTQDESAGSGKKMVNSVFAPWEKLAKQQRRFVDDFFSVSSKMTGVDFGKATNNLDLAETYKDMSKNIIAHPEKILSVSSWMMTEQLKLWENSLSYCVGKKPQPVIAADATDRRFKHEDWEQNPFFNYLKQAYLIQSKAMLDLVDIPDEGEEHNHDQYMFYARQIINSLCPTNFFFSNPEVIKKTMDTAGGNFLVGMRNYLADRRLDPKGFNVSMSDMNAFEVGKNIASTPGKVVFQNEMMQLIQYTPTTPNAFKTPLLIIPPWINKFYILDMKPENSLIKWMVDQGFTTFIISWVNPGKELENKNWENYLLEGPVAAMDAIEKATGEREINTIGYCIGGTLQATTLAYLAAKGESSRVKSATYFTTLLNYSDPGEIGVFINEKMVEGLEQKMEKDGIFDGKAMSTSFTLLRENDLYWSFFINHYLKGEKPSAYDLLFWNADNTNMPGRMHTFYLRNMYLENKLKEPGGITLAGVPIDLRKIKTPVYFLSAIQDHIAKWKSTYQGIPLHSGEVNFVLGGSGHTAGVVNPPAAKKYGYWTNSDCSTDADTWLKAATKHEGSWWPNWKEWVLKHGADEVPARVPGDAELPAIEDAPGSYVKTRI